MSAAASPAAGLRTPSMNTTGGSERMRLCAESRSSLLISPANESTIRVSAARSISTSPGAIPDTWRITSSPATSTSVATEAVFNWG